MPLVIESPESWLRNQQRNLHLIEVDWVPSKANSFGYEPACSVIKKLPTTLHDWLCRELPDTEFGYVGASEISGWISGGPARGFIDFDEKGLAKYIAEWESEERRDLTHHFHRETLDFGAWREQLTKCPIHHEKPILPSNCWWWETPAGMIWSPLEKRDENTPYSSSMNHQDLWFRICELYPDACEIDLDEIVVGKLEYAPDQLKWYCGMLLPIWMHGRDVYIDLKRSYAGYDGFDNYVEKTLPGRTQKQKELCECFGIEDAEVRFYDDSSL
jgi:hypothetical protein